jgi:hypothetical protein
MRSTTSRRAPAHNRESKPALQVGSLERLCELHLGRAHTCQTPMLVLPDDVAAHPLHTSIDIASLCPNAEITVFPWKDPPELKARTINRVRIFLKAHQTV